MLNGSIVMDNGDTVTFSLAATEVNALETEAAESRRLTGMSEQSCTYLHELARAALHNGITQLIEQQERRARKAETPAAGTAWESRQLVNHIQGDYITKMEGLTR